MTTAPTTGAELAEAIGENGPIIDAKAQAAIQGYIENSVKQGVQDQIDERVQAGLADFARAQNAQDGARPNLAPKAKGHNPKALGSVLDGKFDGLTEILAGLRAEKAGERSGAAQKLAELRNAFSSTVPSEGGFLVPEEYRAELMRIALEGSVVRSRARVIPMSVPRVSFPMIDSTSNASSVYGGVIGYWTEEGAQLTASSASFGKVTLDAAKLTAYAEIPNELLADSSPSVGPLVDQIFPEAIRYFEDYAFIQGNGVGQPLGFLNSTAAVTVSKESSQAADTILWANLVKMYARMLPTSLGSAVWVINQDCFPQLAQMTIPVKNVAGTENVGGAPVLVAAGDGTGTPTFSILGRPVVFTEKVPTLGDLGDINFVDLSYYLVGDRQQISAMTSEHLKFNYDTTAYRVITRVDGRPWIQSAITPKTGANTLSPFVKLEAR